MNNLTSNTNRIVWVDFVRSLSIFLVIVIHTSGPLIYPFGEISPADWMTGNIYDSFARMSVPLLFMISGYLLLGKQESISAFYQKRFQKVFIPFLFWSVLYLVWGNGYKDFTFINAVKAIIYSILTTPASFHMWFLYELLAIYLFVPVLRVFILSADRVHLWYLAGIWFLFGPLQGTIEHILGFHIAINLGFFTSYFGFFVIGYLLGKMDYSAKAIGVAAIIYLLAGAYTVYATYSISSQAGDYVDYYYWYTQINIVIMSFSAFILFKGVGERITQEKVGLWFRRFAEASFGIYLIHAMVLIYLKRAGISAFSGPPLISVPAVSIFILLISWGIVAIVRRIPILQELTP